MLGYRPADREGLIVNIVLERTFPLTASGDLLRTLLAAWASERCYCLAAQEGDRYIYERGVRGWRRLFVTVVTDILTHVTLRHEPDLGLLS
jgi:hypothetical protein